MPIASARRIALALPLASTVISSLPTALGDEPRPAEATLKMDVRKLDFEGNKALGFMYMPAGVKLTAERPEGVTKEPKYRAAPKYGVLTLGNGSMTRHAMAFDEPEAGGDAEPKFYPDLNGNGDLTDDGDGAWPTKTEGKEGNSPQYSGTFTFAVTWKGGDGRDIRGEYALNFYRSTDRESINYYRASARTGKIDIEGKAYEVLLMENGSDAIFNHLYDPAHPCAPENLPRPVWLKLDGDQIDARGTFAFGDYNYVARISDDGSKLRLEPTMKVIRLPRVTERQNMLGAGVPVPEFEAVLFKPDAAAGSTPETVKITDYKGKKIVVLDLWASWCGPCKAGLPHLSKVAEETKGQDVVVLAVNVNDEQGAYDRFVREKSKQYAFTFARDPAGRTPERIDARLFKLSGIPATYVIDKTGKIAAAVSGYREGDRQIEQALVNLGVKIEGLKPTPPEAAAAPVKMIPATGMGR